MRPYEVMAIFEATTEPTLIQGILDQALDVIRTTGGTPGAIDRWGKRTLAYEVNHKREGYYVVVEFTAETAHGRRPGPHAGSGRRDHPPQDRAPAGPQGAGGPGRGQLSDRREEQTCRQTTA